MKTKQYGTKVGSFATAKLHAKMRSIFAILVIMTLAIVGCKKEEPDPCTCNPKDHLQAGETCTCGGEGCNCTEQPKVRSAERIDFGTELYTMVSSTKALTDEQWETVKSKLTKAFDTASKSGGSLGGWCEGVFFDGALKIVLLEPQGYNYYNVNLDTGYLSLNASYVINATDADLLTKISAAVMAVFGDAPAQE